MRILIAGLVAITAALALDAAQARNAPNYPWCAHYNAAGGYVECYFDNLQQCLASVSGVGGSCWRNPRSIDAPPYPVRRPRYKRGQ